MTGIFEAVPLVYIVGIVNLLGLPGLVVVLWYVDQRRIDAIIASHKADLQTILTSYKNDMKRQEEMYGSNVSLVKGYEKLAGELANIIRLNTQAMSDLVGNIRNNMFCPYVREKGPGK